ncbi:MAG: aminotransferase class V-fold PLP-dependent enzyme [Hyphomicrobiaceae bacterium]
MTIDLEQVRLETPGVAHRLHLNNAGAALMPAPVRDAMVDYLRREAEIGGYETAGEAAGRLEGVYDSVARLIGAHRDEVALVENATVAWQMAFYAQRFQPGDRILTASAEYAANYVAFLQVAKRTGVRIDVIPNDRSGAIAPDALENMIDGRVRLIAITWVPTNSGLVNPAADVGRIARRHGIPFLLDACQAVGQMPVDVSALGCDMLSATGRKFLRGPRGSGFLYVRRALIEATEPPMIDHYAAPWVQLDRYALRADARRFETWENNYAARLGLGVAIDYALDIGLDDIEARCRLLSARLREKLAGIAGAALHDIGHQQAAIVSFCVDGIDAARIKDHCQRRNINVSASRPSSTLIDATDRNLPTLVRASPHYYNSEEEIDRFADEIARLVEAQGRATSP